MYSEEDEEDEMEEEMGETTPMQWYKDKDEYVIRLLVDESITFFPPNVPKYIKAKHIMKAMAFQVEVDWERKGRVSPIVGKT